MRYCITYLHNGKFYIFPESSIPLVEKAMREKIPVRLEGNLISGSSISHWEYRGKEEYGPHLTEKIKEIFEIESDKKETKSTFWQDIIKINQNRLISGKVWLYNSVIQEAINNSGFSDARSVVDFLEDSGGKWGIVGNN